MAARGVTAGTSRAHWRALVLQVTGTLVAVAAIVLIPLHHLGTRVSFFGAPAVVHREDVQVYWGLVGMLVVGTIASLAGARWRTDVGGLPWSAALAVVGAVMALAFSVTDTGPVQDLDRDVPQRQDLSEGNAVCHSGGDSDECAGG